MKNVFLVLEGNNYNLYEGNYYFDKKNNILIITNTTLYDLNNKEYNLKDIVDIYLRDKSNICNYILDLFTLLIIDYNLNQCLCIQDKIGDNIPIYLYKYKDKFLISNHLKKIITYCNDVQFEIDNVKEFLTKGFLKNKKTLIKNITKLPPNMNTIIKLYDNYKIEYKKKKSIYKKCNYKEKDYLSLLKEEINNKKDIYSNIDITISNGYDSNLILNVLKNNKIRAYSIGGVKGVNEIPQVKENLKHYNNVKLKTALVDKKTLNDYPNIVFQLEGLLYERGIFLQYVLSSMIKHKNKTVLFLGEGADQIFNLNYYNNFIYYIKYIIKLLLNFKFFLQTKQVPNLKSEHDFLTYIIIKKNGIFMNEKNINVNYPYLNLKLLRNAYEMRFKNQYSKKIQKKVCKQALPIEVFQNIKKIGGATDQISLFENEEEVNKLKIFVQKSKYNLLPSKKNNIDYLLKTIYLELFDYIFINKDNKKLLKEKNLNMKLNDFINIGGPNED